MPAFSVALTLARSLLNVTDAAPKIFTDAAMLPYLQLSVSDLRDKTVLAGVPVHNETYSVAVPPNTFALPSQPADILEPIYMEEKAAGDPLYVPMEEKAWEPNAEIKENLRFWVWREEVIVFLGASTARTVKLLYSKDFAVPGSFAAINPVSGSMNYIAKQMAGYAAGAIGENYTRAEWCFGQAEKALDNLTRLAVKGMQGMPVRRRAYGSSRRFARRSLRPT